MHLPALLAGPAPSGSADPFRRCQCCFPPSPASPGSGCPQLQRTAATVRRRGPFIPSRSNSASWRTVGSPIHASRLHCDVCDVQAVQPFGDFQQVGGHCVECARRANVYSVIDAARLGRESDPASRSALTVCDGGSPADASRKSWSDLRLRQEEPATYAYFRMPATVPNRRCFGAWQCSPAGGPSTLQTRCARTTLSAVRTPWTCPPGLMPTGVRTRHVCSRPARGVPGGIPCDVRCRTRARTSLGIDRQRRVRRTSLGQVHAPYVCF